jgi:hypothetical protein
MKFSQYLTKQTKVTTQEDIDKVLAKIHLNQVYGITKTNLTKAHARKNKDI